MLTAALGPTAWAAFTSRAGGVSEGEYASLNLGAGVGDDPAAVAQNRGRLARTADAPVAFVRQVHGADVFCWDAQAVPPLGQEPVADIVLTTTPGSAVAVLVADCVPVLLAGPGGVAAVHAGRKGVLAGAVPAAVAALGDHGVPVTHAAIGPAICGRCYEVPEELRAEASADLPELHATTSWGTPALDLPAGVRAQLHAAGVESVQQHAVCTLEDDRFFSYRRSGVCGRCAGVVRLD